MFQVCYATSQKEKHTNQIHATCTESFMIIAVDRLALGTTKDYETHIAESIDSLAKMYSLYEKCDYQGCRNNMIIFFSQTLCLIKLQQAIHQMEAPWNVHFNELNCNWHPLETIASVCKSSLKATKNKAKTSDPEKFKFKLSGSNADVVNLIWIANKPLTSAL